MEIQVDPALLVVNLENCIDSQATRQIVKGECMYTVAVANDDATMVQIPVSLHCTGNVQQAFGAIAELQQQSVSTSNHQTFSQVQPQQYTQIQMTEEIPCLVTTSDQNVIKDTSKESTEVFVTEQHSALDVHSFFYNDIFNYLTSNTVPEGATMSQKILLKKRAKCYCVKDGILYYGHTKPKKVITDKEEQLTILQDTHIEPGTGIHLGVKKMYSAVNNLCFWRGQYMDVANFVRQCNKCTESGETRLSILHQESSQLSNTEDKGGTGQTAQKSSKVWEKVEVTVHGPYAKTVNHNEYIVTMADPVSHWILAQPVSDGNLPSQLVAFIYDAFCLFGFAKCHIGKLSDELMEAIKTTYQQQEAEMQEALTMLGYPCGAVTKNSFFVLNELEEQCGWVHSLLDSFVHNNLTTWDMGLNKFLFELNTSTKNVAESAFFNMFGRKPISYSQENKENSDINVQSKDQEVTARRRRLQSSILQCRHCEEVFTSKISFRIHQRKHTEEARQRGMLEGEEPIRLIVDRERRLLKRPMLKRRQRFMKQHGFHRYRLLKASCCKRKRCSNTAEKSPCEVSSSPNIICDAKINQSIEPKTPQPTFLGEDSSLNTLSSNQTKLVINTCSTEQSKLTNCLTEVQDISTKGTKLIVNKLILPYESSGVIFTNKTLPKSRDNSELIVNSHSIIDTSEQSLSMVNNTVSSTVIQGSPCESVQPIFSSHTPSISMCNTEQMVNNYTMTNESVLLSHDTITTHQLKDMQHNFSETIYTNKTLTSTNSAKRIKDNQVCCTGSTPRIIIDNRINSSESQNVSQYSSESLFPSEIIQKDSESLSDTSGYSHHVYVSHNTSQPDIFTDHYTISCESPQSVVRSQTLPESRPAVIVDAASTHYRRHIFTSHNTTSLNNSNTHERNVEYKASSEVAQNSDQLPDLNVVVYSTNILNSSQIQTEEAKQNDKEDIKSRCQVEPQFTCDNCGKHFKYKSRLISHMENHHSNIVLRCSKCSYTAKTKQLLSYHQSIHNGTFKCKICSKVFTRKIYLKSHYATVHRTSRLFYTCSLCGAKFMSKTGLERHIETKHEPSKEHYCSLCNYIGNCANSVSRHMIRQHKKQFHCASCDYRSTSEGGLKRHIQIVHNVDERQFPCRHCSYRGAKRRQLLEHEKNMHGSDVSCHQCPICKKMFKTQVMMKHHLLCHTDQHLYSCKGCDYTTRYRQTLHYHIKRTHPDQDVKQLFKGPSETDFKAIIETARQELLQESQPCNESYTTVISKVIPSTDMLLGNNYVSTSYQLHHPHGVICDMNSKEPISQHHGDMITEVHLPMDQEVTIIDSSGLTSNEVHNIVTLANDLNLEKHEMHQLVTLSSKEHLQTITPLNSVIQDSETHQVVTYIDGLSSMKNDSHQHIVTLLNNSDLETQKEDNPMAHINLIDSNNSPEDVMIVPIGNTDMAIFRHEDVEVREAALLDQQEPLLDIVPQPNLEAEPHYEGETSSWNHVTVYLNS